MKYAVIKSKSSRSRSYFVVSNAHITFHSQFFIVIKKDLGQKQASKLCKMLSKLTGV